VNSLSKKNIENGIGEESAYRLKRRNSLKKIVGKIP
jgi:hypothetical protein